MPRIALLTLEDRTGYVIDDALVVTELRDRGCDAIEIPWNEAITANIPVFGEVKGQRVVYAYPDDLKKATEVRLKDAGAKGALVLKK